MVHESTETSWEDHGFVRIKNADGELLAERSDFQHNKQCTTLLRTRKKCTTLVAEVMAAMASRPRSGKGLMDLTAQARLGNSSMPARRASKESLSDSRKGSKELVAMEKEMRTTMELLAKEKEKDLKAYVGKASPPRRASSCSGSQPQSRNQRAQRSSLANHNQQVLRSKVRSRSTSRVV